MIDEPNLVVRLAAKGDGVTTDGRHFPMAAPGDRVDAAGTVLPGPHHQQPPCVHFGSCGGCELQHVDHVSYADFVRDRVAHAVQAQQLGAPEILTPHISPKCSRRRASLKYQKEKGRLAIGFNERQSRRVIDMKECHVLRSELFALIAPLRKMLNGFAARSGEIQMTLCNQGVDLGISGLSPEGLEQHEALGDFARRHGLARLTIDMGYGPETMWEPEPATITLGGVPVCLPSASFVQATDDGEAELRARAAAYLEGSRSVADLFSGLGTFAFGLTQGSLAKVLAVEAARDAHLACQAAARLAGRPLAALHRDLFRNPLRPEELNKFDAVLLDPPRAGARAQIEQVAHSEVNRVCYVSCNPSSWSRDCRHLTDAGFRLKSVKPVGQFLWTTHVELVSLLER